MKKNEQKNIQIGVLTGLGVVLYVILVAWLMSAISNEFAQEAGGILTMVIVLMLLIISAAITGSLVFGYPAYLFINKKYMDAIMMAGASVGTVLVFGLIAISFVMLLS